MRSASNEAQINRVFALFKEWDKGDEIVRKKILTGFIEQSQNKTGPELEEDFAEGASLMLVRLTAWLRLTYLFFSFFFRLFLKLYIDLFNYLSIF